jgi:hypothetical protein
MKKWLSAAVGLILFIPVISLAGPAGDEAQSVAIAMVNRFVDSWNRADGAAYGENYWPDSELVDPTGAIKSGRTAIEQEHAECGPALSKEAAYRKSAASSNARLEIHDRGLRR